MTLWAPVAIILVKKNTRWKVIIVFFLSDKVFSQSQMLPAPSVSFLNSVKVGLRQALEDKTSRHLPIQVLKLPHFVIADGVASSRSFSFLRRRVNSFVSKKPSVIFLIGQHRLVIDVPFAQAFNTRQHTFLSL